ncbi:hypothetical protein [Sphingomonas sp. M1-B02]|uniref:hypothetical protein n=1 Tax=Sphingomonas sp. M1-B02 TaxID=3114300 RepID=UPI0022409DE7|nr:hypothetical protein [Sphingomonas sp. S6-11]UZK66793.1 hypothetical protein OKW87_02845 [Sphingomonas sp. S6-11]
MSMVLKLAGLGLMLAPLPALAQDDAVLKAFGSCVVSADAAGARALIALEPQSGQSRDAARKFVDKKSACGAAFTKDRPDAAAVRGAIAERLYLDSFAAAPAAIVGPPAPFEGSGQPGQVLYDVTRCAASRDPVAADQLVRSAPASADEKAAMQRLIAAIGNCTPGGAKVGFNRAQLRAMTAEGIYKVRNATAVPGATN